MPFFAQAEFTSAEYETKRTDTHLRVRLVVDDTGFEFADYDSLLLFSCKYVIFISETIKLRISQSSCFIEDDPLKGQNKGQTQA